MYTSVASSKVTNACFVRSLGCLSGNLSAKTQDLATSWCSISRSVLTEAFIDHGGFRLCAVIDWSHSSSLHTHTVRYMVNWRLITMICIYLHPIACCFWFLLLPALWTIFKCTSEGIFLVAASAALWWTNWCLHSRCVPMSDIFDIAPAKQLDFD